MRISDWSSDVCSSDLFTQSQGLAVLLAIAFLLLMFAVRGIYSDGLAGNAEVAKLTRAFLLPFVPAMALQIPMFVLSAALRGVGDVRTASIAQLRSEEHTSELQSLMRISYAVFCLKKKKQKIHKLSPILNN